MTIHPRKSKIAEVRPSILDIPRQTCIFIDKKELFVMFWEYLTDMSYVLFSLIGGIVAIAYVYVRKSRKRRVR